MLRSATARSMARGVRSRAACALALGVTLAPLLALSQEIPDMECAFATSPSLRPIRMSPSQRVDSRGLEAAVEGALTIQLNAGPGLSANPEALGAFRRAAARWEAVLMDPITVQIDADFVPLDPGVLGSTAPVALLAGFDDVVGALVLDALDEGADAVSASLPTLAELAISLPPGVAFGGSVGLTKANAKALGADVDGMFGPVDAEILINSIFVDQLDFDSRDGVDPDKADFETLVAHEIGHVLGFISAVDDLEAGVLPEGGAFLAPLDLYRFAGGASAGNPADPAQFRGAARNLRPGGAAIFDDVDHEIGLSTGRSGDGRQASHWKDDLFTGILLGVMDPSAQPGLRVPVTAADRRALDLIGWEVRAAEALPDVTVGGPLRVANGQAVQLAAEISDEDGLGFPIFASAGVTSRVSLIWSFPEGAQPAGALAAFSPTPTLTFPRPPGSPTIELEASVQVFDFLGDTSVASVPIIVSDPPQVSLEANGSPVSAIAIQSGQAVQLSATLSDDDGLGFPVFAPLGFDTLITYAWDFGGGQVANPLQVLAPQPRVTFTGAPGDSFTVRLTVFDAVGVSTTRSLRVDLVP